MPTARLPLRGPGRSWRGRASPVPPAQEPGQCRATEGPRPPPRPARGEVLIAEARPVTRAASYAHPPGPQTPPAPLRGGSSAARGAAGPTAGGGGQVTPDPTPRQRPTSRTPRQGTPGSPHAGRTPAVPKAPRIQRPEPADPGRQRAQRARCRTRSARLNTKQTTAQGLASVAAAPLKRGSHRNSTGRAPHKHGRRPSQTWRL